MSNLPPNTPDRIRSQRLWAGHTQREAAETVHATLRRWQEWEYGERTMRVPTWELYLLKIRFVQPPPARRRQP